VLQDEPAPPSSLQPGLPVALDAFIARALQKKPEHRFQSVAEFAAAMVLLRGGAGASTAVGAMTSTTVGAVTSISRNELLLPTLDGTTLEAGRTLRGRRIAGRPVLALAGVMAVAAAAAIAVGVWLSGRQSAPAADGTLASSGTAVPPVVEPAPQAS